MGNGASQVGVMTFHHRYEWLTQLTPSFPLAKSKISHIKGMKGCSRLYLALDEAAAEFVHSERAEDERVAILFSDGEVACNRDPADKAFASAAGLKNYGRLVTVGMDAQWGRRRRTSANGEPGALAIISDRTIQGKLFPVAELWRLNGSLARHSHRRSLQ